ncbi:MAG: serine hydrolase [Planctomycetota bacterium]|jgi:CubicO group peptidase (beta-lactamase class C family)|nr:serine hydrolase [Planctomycetota bacterium]
MAAVDDGARSRRSYGLTDGPDVVVTLQRLVAEHGQDVNRQLRGRLEAHRSKQRVPALAAVLLDRDGRSACVSSGVSDLETGRSVDLDTIFAWYSLTKVITATVCVRELSRVGLSLDARVVDLVPDLIPGDRGRSHAYWKGMTVRHLVSHGAGFADHQLHAASWFLDAGETWPEPRSALREVLARRHWLSRPPGATYRYTNLGYALLGEVLAEVTGKPFRELVLEHGLRSVGALHTGFEPWVPRQGSGHVARGHVRRWTRMGLLTSALGSFSDGAVPGSKGAWLKVKVRKPLFSPHGGLWGPPGDLVHVLHEHLAAGHDPEHPLAEMQRIHCPGAGRKKRHGEGGLGWRVHTGTPLRLTHGGRGPGFTAEIELRPREGRAVAVLGNATFDAKSIATDLISCETATWISS